MSAASIPPRSAVLFTQQFVGRGTRKTGMVFWAETLAALGWKTSVVTTQVSWLSRLLNRQRLAGVPAGEINAWVPRGKNLEGFIWVPLVHPVGTRWPLVNALTSPLAALFARLLPKEIRSSVAEADLIVIESCAAAVLFPALKRLAPRARIVYCASDRLGAVGMHPVIQRALDRTQGQYDLIRVPSPSMLADFASSSRTAYIPHGVARASFDRTRDNPYRQGSRNAVVGGDMAFDLSSVTAAVKAFPDVNFHFFGKMVIGELEREPNVVLHGEVPFETLIGFLQHADVGVAPYVEKPGLNYLAESSLKLAQYAYCRLPTIAPAFAAGSRSNIVPYDPADPPSAAASMAKALKMDRARIDRSDVIDWDTVIERVLTKVDLAPRPGEAGPP
jgi:2-beta-glucuronyltransferase